jgi:16S rRNA processing protein RimM
LIKVPSDNLLLLGKVLGPHGRKGLMRIRTHAQSGSSFPEGGAIFLKTGDGEIREFDLITIKPHKKFHLLRLKGIDGPAEADQYRNAEILINKEDLSREEDEYFWHEIIGLEVYLNTGEFLGMVHHILSTGSNDIYVVRNEGMEVLVPAIHDVVEKIDLDHKRMIISEMEGLLNPDEI